MIIKRRQALIAMLVMSQLGCMTFGVLWASHWLHEAFDQIIHRSVALHSQATALTLARRATDSTSDDAPSKLNELLELADVPAGGFLAALRLSDGQLLATSNSNELLSGEQQLGDQTLQSSADDEQTLLAALQQGETSSQPIVQGTITLAGAPYDVTAVSSPKLDAAIIVAASGASTQRLVSELVTPLVHVGFVLTGAVVAATAVCTVLLVRRFDGTLMEVSSSVEREVERRTLSLQRSRNAVVFGLAKLAESRDKDAGQHLERLRTYVTILASELAKHNSRIDHHYVANLAIAAALHDVGKMGVPDAVILKLGKLTAAERRAMQMHTVLGDECLASVERMMGDRDEFVTLARQVAAAHHEQWDGSGYPYGLQGKDIPLAARIVAVADVYDALTSHREYRPAASHAEAREWIVSHYGSQFDTEVVEAFIAREADFAKISEAAAHLDDRRSTPAPDQRTSGDEKVAETFESTDATI
jgi:response regulator RpfG family c-di-GMP phosphodiesterase